MVNKFKIKTKKVLSIILLSTMLVSNIGTSVSAMSVSNNDLSTQTEVNVANVSNVDVQDSDLEDLAASPEQVTISENETEEEKEYETPEWNKEYSIIQNTYVLTSEGYLYKIISPSETANPTNFGNIPMYQASQIKFDKCYTGQTYSYLTSGEDVYIITETNFPEKLNGVAASDISYIAPSLNLLVLKNGTTYNGKSTNLAYTTNGFYQYLTHKKVRYNSYGSNALTSDYFIATASDMKTVNIKKAAAEGKYPKTIVYTLNSETNVANILTEYKINDTNKYTTIIKVIYTDGSYKKFSCDYIAYSSGNFQNYTFSEVETGTNEYTTFIGENYGIKDGIMYNAVTDEKIGTDEFPYIYGDAKVSKNGDFYINDSLVTNLAHICSLNTTDMPFTEEDVEEKNNGILTCQICGKEYEKNAAELDNLAKDPQFDAEISCTEAFSIRRSIITGKELDAISIPNAVKGHDLDTSVKYHEVPATCTEYGTYDYLCKKCGQYVTQIDTSAEPSHIFGTEVADKEDPKCGDTVTYTKTCTICGITQSRSEKIEHEEDPSSYTSVDATCISDGQSYYLCKKCGEKINIRTSPKTEHQFSISNSTATCTKAGTATLTCNVCGKVIENADVDALGHDYVIKKVLSGTCNEEGTAEYVCTRCNDSYIEKTKKVDHVFDSGTDAPKATCETDGKKIYTCTNCGYTKTETVKKLGHDYEAQIITAPTADTDGKTQYTCKNCGKTYTTITKSVSNYTVSAGYKTIAITNKANGRLYLTGTSNKYIGNNQNIVPVITYTDETYGDRQIKTVVDNSSYGVKEIDGKQYYYGIPKSITDYTVNTIVHHGDIQRGEVHADNISYNNELLLTYKDNELIVWNDAEYTRLGGSNYYLYDSNGKFLGQYDNGFNILQSQVSNKKVISMARSDYSVFFVTEDNKLYYRPLFIKGYTEYVRDDVTKVTALDEKIYYLTTDGKIHFIKMPNDSGGMREATYIAHSNGKYSDEEQAISDAGFSEYMTNTITKLKKAHADYTDLTFMDIAISGSETVGLTTDGKLVKLINENYEYDSFNPVDRYENLSDKTFIKLYGGSDHFLAIDTDNNLYAWGDNASGQLGTGDYKNSSVPVQITNGVCVKEASAGDKISAYTDSEGNVYVWGDNNYSQLGILKPAVKSVPSPVILCNLSHVHSYNKDSYSETTKLTCAEDGKIVRTCTECGQKEEITIPASDHVFVAPYSHTFEYYVDYVKNASSDPVITVSDTDKYYIDKNNSYIIKAEMPSGTKYYVLSLENDMKVRHENGTSSVIDVSSPASRLYNREYYNDGKYNSTAIMHNAYSFYVNMYYTEIIADAISDTADTAYSFDEDVTAADVLKKLYQECYDKYFIKSCSSDHTEVKYCKYCFKKQYETKPAADHTISKYGDRVTKPGYIIYRCASCNEAVKEDQIVYSVKGNNNKSNLYGSEHKPNSSHYAVYIDQNNKYAAKESFTKSAKYEDEIILPKTGANSGSFTLDLGILSTDAEEKVNTISGNNTLTKLVDFENNTTYKPGDKVSRLTTKDGKNIILSMEYDIKLNLPSKVYYDGVPYYVSKWRLTNIPSVNGVENHKYNGSSYYEYTIGESFDYLLNPNDTFYLIPMTYTCAGRQDPYTKYLSQFKSNSSTSDYQLKPITGRIFYWWSEIKDEYPSANVDSYSGNKLIKYSYVDFYVNGKYIGDTRTDVDQYKDVNGLEIYCVDGIKKVLPDYKNYGVVKFDGNNRKFYLQKLDKNTKYILIDTLNNTQTVVNSINDIPRYTLSDNGKKILKYWSYDKAGKSDFYQVRKEGVETEITLYSQWVNVTSGTTYAFDTPQYKLASDLKEGQSLSANSVLLIGNVKTGLSSLTNSQTEFKLNTDKKILSKMFKKRMQSSKKIDGLKAADNQVLLLSDATDSKAYVTDETPEYTNTIQNHKVAVYSNLTVYFNKGGEMVNGYLAKDHTDGKVKVTDYYKLYTPQYVYLNRTTLDTVTKPESGSDTGFIFIKDGKLCEVYYNKETDTFADLDGNALKEGTFVYESGSVFAIMNKTPQSAIMLDTALWSEGISINLAVTDENKTIFYKKDGDRYLKCNYADEDLIRAYSDYLNHYTAGAVQISKFAESYLLYAVANGLDLADFLKADSYTLLSFPTESEVKTEHIYVEKYIVDKISDLFGAFFTVTLKPQYITLDTFSEKAYEYQDTEIKAEALKDPSLNEWRLKLDTKKILRPLTVNFISKDNGSYYTFDSTREYFDFVKFPVDENINQKLTLHVTVDSLNDTFTKDNLQFIIKNERGLTKETLTGENGGITITESSDTNKFIDGEHIQKIVQLGARADDKDWYILTEEGNIWYTSFSDGIDFASHQPEFSYNQEMYKSISNYDLVFQKIAANAKFKDFYGFGVRNDVVALDMDGNLWGNRRENGTSQTGFRQISKNIEFVKFGERTHTTSYSNREAGITLLDNSGNIWLLASGLEYNMSAGLRTDSSHLTFSGTLKDNNLADTVIDVNNNNLDMNVVKLTDGIRFIDVANTGGFGNNSISHISAIDENGDLYLSGWLNGHIGWTQNGKHITPQISTAEDSESYIAGFRKLKDLYPGYLNNVKWKSIQCSTFSNESYSYPSSSYTTDINANKLSYIDTNGNLYEQFDDGVGYEITEINVKDGAGAFVLDNSGKLHLRKKDTKWQCQQTSNILYNDYTFKEIGSTMFKYFKTVNGEYVFDNVSLPWSDTKKTHYYANSGKTDSNVSTNYGFNFTKLFKEAFLDCGSFGKSSAYNYFEKVGLNNYAQGIFPDIDADLFVIKEGDVLAKHKAYDIEIDTDSLYQIENILIQEGDYLLLNAYPSKDTIVKITDAQLKNYGEVDTLITSENEEEKLVKSETQITMNTLKLPRISSTMDGALYELKSTYDEDEYSTYSEMIKLDVVSLKELKVEYTGDPVTIGKDADLNDLKYTLVYEDGKEIETDYESLTKKPISLPITDYVNTFDEFEFENVKASVEIPGKNGIVDLSASYPESVFKGQNFDPAKVQITANWSDGTTTHPTVTENDFASLKITKIGDNEREVTVEDMTTPLIINGYYYDHLEVNYNGEAVKLNSDYDKNDLDIKVYYTANSFNKQFDPVDPDDVISATENVIGEDLMITKIGTNTFNIQLNADKTINADVDIEGIDFVNTLTAKYTGPNIYIGENYNKDDVEVLATYESTKTETVSSTDWTESSLLVENVGDNTYTATYKGESAEYTVTGYKEAAITAKYTGDPVKLNSDYKKSDVKVTLFYTDNSSKDMNDNWTESSLTVTKLGLNEYTATVIENGNTLTDTYQVTGIDDTDHLEAKYIGNDVYVSKNYDKNKVEVKMVYLSGKEVTVPKNEWTEDSLTITKTGDNVFTATKDGKKAEFVVTGYKEQEIVADYNGADIKLGEEYQKKDVTVKVIYTNHTEKTLANDEWTESSLIVNNLGSNEYTATYKDLTDTYTVNGIDHEVSLKAEYAGPNIYIGKPYDKNKVTVTAVYKSGKEVRIPSNIWTENSLLVEKDGINNFKASYNGMTADYKVTGFKEAAITAKYNGSDIQIEKDYKKSDVTVTVIYTDSSTRTLKDNEWTESSLKVTTVGPNVYEAVYKPDENLSFTDNYTVIGFDESDHLEAKYNGPEIYTSEKYNKDDVIITKVYKSGRKEIVPSSEWTENSLIVTKTGENEFIANSNGLSTKYIVNGYEISKITAEYTGKNIQITKNYDKKDVAVTIHYTNGKTKDLIKEDWKENSLLVEKTGKNEYTATYNRKNKTYTAEYNVTGIDEINSLKAQYNGPNIYIGNTYDKNNVIVTVVYESGKETILKSSEWNEDSLIVTKEGENTFTASYKDKQVPYIITGFKEKSIIAKYTGPDIEIKKDYEKSNVTVTVIYTDNTNRILKDDEWTEDSLTVTKEGPNEFTAVYKPNKDTEFKTNYTVIGFEEGCHLEAKYTGKDIYVSEKYNKKDVIVTKIYNSGKTEVLSDDEWTESSLIVTKTGENIFTAKTKDLETSYIVTGYKIENITAEYKGKNIPIGEDYDKKDVIVTIHYTNGTSEKIPDNEWKESSLTVTKIGDNDFTALYKKDSEEYTADYKIIGIDKINRIEAHYTGEEIFITEKYKKSDVKITVIYQSGEKKEISDNEWNESSLIVTKTGDNNFTATYKTFETNYTVPGISISKITAKYSGKDIEIDNKYSKNDVNVTVIYTNGKTKTLTSSEWKESGLIVTKAGKNKFTASYTERNKVYTADFIVKGKAPTVKPEDPSTPIQNTIYTPIINIVKTGDLGYGIIGFAFIIIGISVIIIKKRKLNKKH